MRRQMQTAKFRTPFLVNFLSVLRKDTVDNYASIWTLFSQTVRGLDVLYNPLNISYQVATPSVGGATRFANLRRKFSKTKKSAVDLCQILRMVTIEIVIYSTRVIWIHVTISCRYCIAFEVMLLFLVMSRSKAGVLFVHERGHSLSNYCVTVYGRFWCSFHQFFRKSLHFIWTR